jgi:diacylglycerol kinase family enzyme
MAVPFGQDGSMAERIAILLNTGSGSGREPADPEALRAKFAARGLAADVFRCEAGESLPDLLRAALETKPACLVAAGGDGTVNAVAAAALEHDIPLGILPLGTLNHFARDLDIPGEPEAAVDMIAAGNERRVDVATANGRLFLNNASLGLYATMVVDRERQERRLGRGQWSALLRATVAALRDPEAFEVAIEADGRALRRRTPFVFVGNNDYIVQGPDAGRRASVDDGLLAVYVLHPRTAAGLLWLALRTLLRGTAGARDLDAFATRALEVRARGARLPFARDGEVEALDAPIRFAVWPGALRVLAPAPEAEPGMTGATR